MNKIKIKRKNENEEIIIPMSEMKPGQIGEVVEGRCNGHIVIGKILYIQQDDNWERRFDSVTIYGPTKARELAAALNKAADELEKEE